MDGFDGKNDHGIFTITAEDTATDNTSVLFRKHSRELMPVSDSASDYGSDMYTWDSASGSANDSASDKWY